MQRHKKKNQHKLLELRHIALLEHIETHTLTNTKKNSSETTEHYADMTKSDDVNEEKVLKHLTIDKNSVYGKQFSHICMQDTSIQAARSTQLARIINEHEVNEEKKKCYKHKQERENVFEESVGPLRATRLWRDICNPAIWYPAFLSMLLALELYILSLP